MILFKDEHVEPILNGTKTQTRRLWKSKRAKIRSIHLAKTVMLSKEFFAKLHILDVRRERLGDITQEAARAEGYSSREEYIEKFKEINKKKLRKLNDSEIENSVVTAIKFEVVV